MFADVQHLARQQAPLDPPFVEIVQAVRIFRHRQHELCGLVEFLFAAQQLDPREHVAGVAVQLPRHRLEQRLEVGGFLVGGDARLGQRDMARTEALGGAHAAGFLLGAVEQRVHPRLVVARRQQRAEHGRALRSRCLPTCRHCARPRGPAVRHWRDRRARSSPSPARICPWPKSAIRFRTRTRPWRRRGGRPTGRPRCAGAGRSATASSDWPKQTRGSARRRRHCCRCAGSAIPRACGRPDPISRPAPGWRRAGFCLRTSSMTFSRASLSACDVEDVAATAAGATCLRGGGRAACWRVAGARTGGAGAGAAAVAGAAAAGLWAAGALVCAAGFGNDVAGDRPRLRQWNFWLGPGIQRERRQSDGQRQARGQCGRSQGGGAGGRDHGCSFAAANHSIGPALGLFD